VAAAAAASSAAPSRVTHFTNSHRPLLSCPLAVLHSYLTMLYGAKWYAAITVAWGIVAACCAAVSSRSGFFTTRLLLGVAEAGAWPSACHLLCQFYPADRWVGADCA
jgi:hypothetical protein